MEIIVFSCRENYVDEISFEFAPNLLDANNEVPNVGASAD